MSRFFRPRARNVMPEEAAVYPSLPDARPLALGTAVPGPNVIGATGGSGTRVVARLVREAGVFTGTDLNQYEDALPFGEFSDRWINRFVGDAGEPVVPDVLDGMRTDFDRVVRDHLVGLSPSAQAWGWKEPRSIYYLPLLDAALPTVRFIHFIRDGRDMAFSENQN